MNCCSKSKRNHEGTFEILAREVSIVVGISSYVLCESRKAVTTKKIKSNNSDRDVVEYYHTSTRLS
jgi:hypothetical protein